MGNTGFLLCWPREVQSSIRVASAFVKDKVSVGVWVHLWAFYLVPLAYISVFVLVPYCLDDGSFVV